MFFCHDRHALYTVQKKKKARGHVTAAPGKRRPMSPSRCGDAVRRRTEWHAVTADCRCGRLPLGCSSLYGNVIIILGIFVPTVFSALNEGRRDLNEGTEHVPLRYSQGGSARSLDHTQGNSFAINRAVCMLDHTCWKSEIGYVSQI